MPARLRGAILMLAAAGCTSPGAAEPAAVLAAYRQSFEVAAGSRLVAALPQAQLPALAADVRIVWLGDHHYSERLHRLQRGVLDRLLATGRPLALLLEAIGEQDEPLIAAYVAGAVDERALRVRMRRRWPGSWLDDEMLDAPHYRALLAFARAHGLPVRALEPTPRLPLAQRDGVIAANVRRAAAELDGHLLVAVLGQAHLLGDGDVVARTGLPALILGGVPPAGLRAAGPREPAIGWLYRSDGGVFWFSDLFAAAP